MTVPVIYSACLCYPAVRFIFITRRSMTSIFINAPANLTVIGLDLTDDYNGVQGIWRLYRELKLKYAFDGFIDLHDVLRTKIFAAFCRLGHIPVSVINKGRKGKRALTAPGESAAAADFIAGTLPAGIPSHRPSCGEPLRRAVRRREICAHYVCADMPAPP